MGCINSRADINDPHPNIFQVINVDDLGNSITPGRLEVTDVELILYQRGKQPIRWSLHCLRRYGHDASIFSFESGRRCFTGPAIYAFKCQRAQQLFNLVQRNIQVYIIIQIKFLRLILLLMHTLKKHVFIRCSTTVETTRCQTSRLAIILLHH